VWILKRAAQSLWKLPKKSAVPVPGFNHHLTRAAMRAGHRLGTPSYILSLSPSPINPSPQDFKKTSTELVPTIMERGRTSLSPVNFTTASMDQWHRRPATTDVKEVAGACQ